MATITRRWIELDYNAPGALRAEDIPYDDTFSVKDAIDTKGAAGTEELMQYHALLQTIPYRVCWFDLFTTTDYVDAGYTSASYDRTNTQFSGVAGDILQSINILDGDTNTYYSFYLRFVADDYTLISASYSVDGGTTWNPVNNDERIVVENGFSGDLRIRFNWSGATNLKSYAVYYDEQANCYVSDTRLFETLTIDNDISSPTIIELPNNAVYTNDGKSLEIYLNRVRLVPGIDYNEVDNRRVEFLIDLKANDTIVFIEKFGYIDTSIENKTRLDYEHNDIGQHIFTDLTTGQKYRLAVDNGDIVLIPVT